MIRQLALIMLEPIAQMNILFIDTEFDLLDSLQQWFTFRGHYAACLSEIENLTFCLQIRKYDVVCLDLLIPDSPGVSIIEEIRILSLGTSVVVMSAVKDPRFARLAMQNGAAAVVSKPVVFSKLEQIVKESRSERFRKQFTGPVSVGSHIRTAKA